jgi:signal transduction histidine kinase
VPTRAPHPPTAPDGADPRAIQTLYRISTLIGKTENPKVALRHILEDLVSTFHAASGSVALLNPDTGRLEVEVQHGLPLDASDDLPLRLGQGITGWVAFHGKPLLIPDVAADSRYVRIRPEVRCEMAVPMLETLQVIEEASQVIGVINLDSDLLGAFTPADLRLLEQLAAEVTAVMQRLWELQHLRGKARQLEGLIGNGLSLVAQFDEHALAEKIVRDSRDVMQTRACALFLHDSTRGTARLTAFVDTDVHATAHTLHNAAEFNLDDGVIATAIHTRKIIEFPNIRSPEFRELPDIPDDDRLYSALVVPLVREKEVLGAFALFTDRPHRFSNDEKRLAAALAALGLVALQNARLYARVFQSEESLRKSEQLTTLGLLAAEIAHEIRNPLTVIKLLFGSLGLEFPEGDLRRTDTRVIGEKLDQLEAIVSRVLNFAKAPASVHSQWNASDIIADTIVLIRLKLTQSKIQLHFAPPPAPLVVEAHKGQIQQVLLNLLLNATQAMPTGGRIDIDARGTTRDGASLLLIDVTDTGPGIPETLREKIFESFLSGRADGTGLGLGIAKRIMRSHHGDIELVSTSPAGTTMRITLPLLAQT